MPTKLATVNFGGANGGLATVGYRIMNPDLTLHTARTTSGVSEVVTNSGIYRASINYPPNFVGIVFWDTGEGSPQYAAESLNPVDATSVADEMRTLLRSMNTSLSSQLEKLKGKKSEAQKIDLSKIEDSISGLRERIDLVQEVISKIEVSPKVEVKQDFSAIESMLKDLRKESGARDENLKSVLRAVQGGFENRSKVIAVEIKRQLESVLSEMKTIDGKSETRIAKKFDFVNEVLKTATDELIGEVKKEFTDLVKRLSEKSKAEDLLEDIVEAVKSAGSTKKRSISQDPELVKMAMAFGGRQWQR